MFKRLITITVMFVFLFSSTSFAHTGVEHSFPANQSVLEEAPQEILIKFNTRIEQTSSIKLFNQDNREVIFSETSIDGDTLIGLLSIELVKGEYTVYWEIIGADGHPIEGSFSFLIISDNNTTDSEEEIKPAQSEERINSNQDKVENQGSNIEEINLQNSDYSPHFIFYIIAVLLAILAIIMSFYLFRKGKNQ
ncbi:copper resistance CopC family protein [Alkalihalobacillus pseudalcaliphilus]|uniref:copper resistance CopC family protein n=1 Tax=Alkalihalobacillus pseudalcaliphilus TaxID=79884 RepID=UPI00064E0A27|nr:copper resistance protein CopC [Alkalihalobacillus pseudalcaliphilus]KMK76285.1 hypothetical protein AB990_13840 [Alkalihalobacillus pseudalcaliphilus]